MHVVIALLGSIATILYLLNHFGVDIGWLNPFWWKRRRQWAAKYQGDPIYSIEDPLHVAAHLLAAPQLISAQLRTLAGRSQSKLSSEQAESMLAMMNVVAGAEGSSSTGQREYVEGMRTLFMPQAKGDGPWN